MTKKRQSEGEAKIRVLIADDAPDVAVRLKRMLEELEHVQVIGPARDGGEALQLYNDHQPHGLVLDLAMPVMNGLEVLRAVRKKDDSALIITLTNHADAETRERCLESGANHFLHKSTEFERVAEVISEFAKTLVR